MNKENIPEGPKLNVVLCKHPTVDVTKQLCRECAMTEEDWKALETLPEQALRDINTFGLLSFLGYAVIEGELFHASDLIDSDEEKMEED